MEPTQPPPPRPPVARRIPHVEVQHGERRVDDYFWLREKSRPDVRAYLEAENAYTAAVMQPSAALQEALYREMLGHIQETDSSAPYREGAFEHWVRTEAGLQYPIYCRRRSATTDVAAGPDEITLDLNELARGESFMALGFYVPDDAGRRLAYATDRTGFREYTLAIKDLDSGALLPERIERVTSAAWSADGQILFYTLEDDAKRSYRLYRHTLGTPPVGDTLVYEERDERFDLAVSRTRSGTYLVLTAVSHTATEAQLLEAARPEGDWRLVAARRPDHEYFLDHRGGELLVRTNDHGRNFRLVRAPVDDPGEAHWVELVPHRADVMLEEHLAFARHLVLCERAAALPCVRLLDLEGGVEHTLTFPEPAYAVSPEVNRVFETTTLRLLYESFVTPPSVLAYEMDTRVRRVLKQTPVPGYDPTRFETERLVAQALDGTAIPISLVRAKGLRRDGTAPLLLHGYGAYGFPEETHFSAARLALLERGVGYAIAHVRGGGEGGKAWHDQGRMLAKENTFTDCVTVAEHLVAAGYTSPDRLALEGRSAGGLLVGAVLNLRPDLFRAAHLGVPFLDVINTMLDETLPLTVTEFEEWGNPKKPDEYAVLRRYSPYDNLTRRAYPAILVTTSLNDSQVMFWEPAKWVAKLRRLKTDDRLLLLKMNMDAGHGGASGRYEHLRETAFEYAFLLRELGVETNGVVLAP